MIEDGVFDHAYVGRRYRELFPQPLPDIDPVDSARRSHYGGASTNHCEICKVPAGEVCSKPCGDARKELDDGITVTVP